MRISKSFGYTVRIKLPVPPKYYYFGLVEIALGVSRILKVLSQRFTFTMASDREKFLLY